METNSSRIDVTSEAPLIGSDAKRLGDQSEKIALEATAPNLSLSRLATVAFATKVVARQLRLASVNTPLLMGTIATLTRVSDSPQHLARSFNIRTTAPRSLLAAVLGLNKSSMNFKNIRVVGI